MTNDEIKSLVLSDVRAVARCNGVVSALDVLMVVPGATLAHLDALVAEAKIVQVGTYFYRAVRPW